MRLSGLIRMLRILEKRRIKMYSKDFDPRCYRTDYEYEYSSSAEINSVVEFESGKIFLSQDGLSKEEEFSDLGEIFVSDFKREQDRIVFRTGVTWILVQGYDTYLMEIGEFIEEKGFLTRSSKGDITKAMWINSKYMAELFCEKINKWIKNEKNKFEVCAVLAEIDYKNKVQEIIDF